MREVSGLLLKVVELKVEVYAYKDESVQALLHEHNRNVGEAVGTLFKEFLKTGIPAVRRVDKFTGIRNSTWVASIIAGALHDIGKASMYYQEVKRARTFVMHEFISAIILVEVAERAVENNINELSCIFNLAAWATSRHHSAMDCRHPGDLRRYLRGGLKGYLNSLCKRYHESLRDALTQLDKDLIVEGLPKKLRKSRLLSRILDSVDVIKSNDPNNVIKADTEALVEHVNNSPKFCNLSREVWMSLVEIVSGALIVSDILVASRERRRSDDSFSSVYERYWEKELGVESRELVLNENNIGEAVDELLAMF